MHHPTSLCAVATAVLAILPGAQAGFYPKASSVLQINGKTYKDLVANSNKTTILEFYAPWCGHCQNLKPAYEKAAKNLEGLANVAAIDCDDEMNKPFCGSMGIQGFPTLKIVRPPLNKGKPLVEDYNGPRSAAGIVDAVVERINNHVKRVTDKDLDEFLDKTDGPKAILFTDKGTVSALLKGVAIDFLDVIKIAQIRSKEKGAVEKFGIEKFPTLILIPGKGQEPIKYDGPVKKADMVKFLSQAGAPNPDPAPASTKKADKKSKKASTKKAEPEDTPSAEEPESTETVKTPVITEVAPPIPTIHEASKLAKECLSEKSTTCVLAFVPAEADRSKDVEAALNSLADIVHKYAQAKRKLFPIFAIPSSNPSSSTVIKALELGDKPMQLVAINARRNWWRQYPGEDFSAQGIENWVDAIRMGEGAKKKLPEGLVAEAAEATGAEDKAGTASESSSETKGSDPVPEPETAKPAETPATEHDEL
ncbi:hypothetical protein PpBr36_07278 [Pyricularia pennisetigena]|uniref:hypothetical protein n=1 Tax=Pyricularia pennisetigena TaxID=1578925 RepID=UPI001154779B|nr:hypothetical protein PpBr36_07278 [Pyricularia pennisetigena]TLS25668.1 hypothetical protein PpBr36_07278 [Pyricularia pennisetigena]